MFVRTIVIICALILTSTSYAVTPAECGAKVLPETQGPVQVTPEDYNNLKAHEIESSGLQPSLNLMTSGGNSEDTAIMIFAVTGTVMLFMWIPYAALLTYRAIKKPECFDYHSLISADFNYLTNNESRSGTTMSLQYSYFLREKFDTDGKEFGFNFELGRYHFKDKEDAQLVNYTNNYWLAGPSILFGTLIRGALIPAFKIDLLAGTSFHSEVKLMLKADLKAMLIFPNQILAGIGGGADYIKGQRGRGILTHVNDLSTHILLTIGYFF